MTFIDLGDEYTGTKEPELAPDGLHDLLCKAVEHEQDDGKNNLRVQIVIDGGEDYADMFHYVALPKPDDDARDAEKGQKAGTSRNFKLLMIKRFVHAFSIPVDGTKINPNDIPGTSARLGLAQGTYTRKDGSTARNNKLTLPELPANAAASGEATSRPRRRAAG